MRYAMTGYVMGESVEEIESHMHFARLHSQHKVVVQILLHADSTLRSTSDEHIPFLGSSLEKPGPSKKIENLKSYVEAVHKFESLCAAELSTIGSTALTCPFVSVI
jgi:hypothetical protein